MLFGNVFLSFFMISRKYINHPRIKSIPVDWGGSLWIQLSGLTHMDLITSIILFFIGVMAIYNVRHDIVTLKRHDIVATIFYWYNGYI
jgi:hypothetical protein